MKCSSFQVLHKLSGILSVSISISTLDEYGTEIVTVLFGSSSST